MKIVQISSFFHPSIGGVERQVEEIAYHLSNSGHNVKVYTTDATHGPENRMQRLHEEYRGYRVLRFKYILKIGYFFRFAPGLLWQLLRDDYDLIHIHNSHDAHLLGALIIRKLRRKKILLTGHNPYIVNSEKRGETLHIGVKFFEFVLNTFFIRWLDGYVALLESERETVRKRFGLKPYQIEVIPNGIQNIYYTGAGNADEFIEAWDINTEKWDMVVGTASRINFVKGLQNLEKAVKNLPKVLFIFVGGDAGYLSNLKKLYAGLPNVVITERYLSSEEVKNFYAAIDFFLLPSVYEPFGMTVVEAMAQGKPVLATSNGGPKEIIDKRIGEIIDPNDQDLWLKRIKYYSKHIEEVEEMGSYARRSAGKYQWAHVISQLEAFYRTISVS